MAAGSSPFTVPGYFNPIQLAWVLQFTTFIPFSVWAVGMCVITFLLVVVVAKKNAVWYLLSAPFIFSLQFGMVDMLLWVPARLGGGIGLSLLTMKPHLFLLYAPFQFVHWIREKNWRQIYLCMASVAVLWGIPTVIDPGWLSDWLSALPTLSAKMEGASISGYGIVFGNIYFYYALFAVVMIVLLQRIDLPYYLATSFSPAFSIVDHCLNAEYATWRYTLLSWLIFPLGIGKQVFELGVGSQQYFLMGILIFIEQTYRPALFYFRSTVARKQA